MGLFDKREPCAICGGKVKALFPWKVEGQLVCNACHGVLDIPEEMQKDISMAKFVEYRNFREENHKLKDIFNVGLKVDFGWLDDKIMFDFTNKLMCLDKNLDKTIFEGGQIRSFTIREDAYSLFEGSPAGLMCYPSSVPDRVMAMAPQINQYRMQEQMRRNMEMMRDMRDGDNDRTYYGSSTFDIPEPFNKFVVEIQMEHPYWRTLTLDTSGPSFSSTDPDVNDYMNSYQERSNTMRQLAQALMDVAFPGAPVQQMGNGMGGMYGAAGMGGMYGAAGMGVQNMYGAAGMGAQTMNRSVPMGGQPVMNSSMPVDAVAEIQRFKALMDQGIISEAEFEAKKRQLLGL